VQVYCKQTLQINTENFAKKYDLYREIAIFVVVYFLPHPVHDCLQLWRWDSSGEIFLWVFVWL